MIIFDIYDYMDLYCNNIIMQKIIFFDIETVSGVASYDQLSDAMQHLWDKKSQSWITESLSSADLYIQKA